MSIEKLDLQSPDQVNANLEKLAALFPNCVTETAEGKAIDFDLLKQELNHAVVEGTKERYRLEWPGKKEAIVTANIPTTKTLRPVREDSVDFDNTENLYIEGDNLEVLKLLQESYLGKIKMIYIDPPYNTGKDFVYKDNFTVNSEEWKEKSGDYDEYNQRLVANPETSGRYHSDWLSMMYPRLKLARNLLMEEGVVMIHIDENEYPNLEKILSEIFGEVNNLGTIVWDKRNPKGEVAGVAQQHELISVYCKNKQVFKERSELRRPKENAQKILEKACRLKKEFGKIDESVQTKFKQWLSKQDFSGGEKAYNLLDEDGKVFQTVSMAAPDKPETRSHRPLIHPTTGKPCPVPEKGWRFPDKTMDKLLELGQIVFGKDESSQPRRKYLLN
jgi:adenine-specific DNA-methyltransferase